MKKIARAFSPGHITGFFAIADQADDPLFKGSLGAGFSTTTGVTTQVEPGEGIFINGKLREDAKVSQRVLKLFYERTAHSTNSIMVSHQIELPEGSGFGTSGAGALSLAYALNHYFDSPLSKVESAQIAHQAEVECKTGLGTVIGEYAGGFEIRTKEGAPGIGEIQTFQGPEDLVGVFAFLGPYPTPGMLKNEEIRKKINQFGPNHLKELPGGSYDDFLAFSKEFTLKTGLCPQDLQIAMQKFDSLGIKSSMLMFGKALFTLISPTKLSWTLKQFKSILPEADIINSSIDFIGGRVLK